jgi:hypothetical protein
VRLVTALSPVASLEDVASHRSRSGQRSTGRKGGGDTMPGYKNRRRRDAWSKLCWLRTVGFSLRQIAAIVDSPHTTVARWLTRHSP